jgi:hypothetical protein
MTTIVFPKEGDAVIIPENQRNIKCEEQLYFKLVKNSCPDISYSVRELSKVEDEVREGHFEALLQTIKFELILSILVYSSDQKLKMMVFNLEGISDSELKSMTHKFVSMVMHEVLWCTYLMEI